MFFSSFDFALFIPVVFILYWFVVNKNLKFQNLLIVAASYYFYACWDYRFLFLILFSTLIDYLVCRKLRGENNLKKRKTLLLVSIVVNLGFLGFFKYYNFFIENFITAFSFFGTKINVTSLQIVLPVGISFYTFQTLSYSIDVYKRKIAPTNNFIAFCAFVSFFPQLVAGPIERAKSLLPQFYSKRNFEYGKAVDGLRQILWGLFKKIVIADNCAEYANLIFNNSGDYSGITLAVGALFFTFQIYGDFSGYSDIAIGVARLFGFNLNQNFKTPYFSKNITEFWRRWHISLSTWFRDYVYFPLGGSRVVFSKNARNILIVFTLSGFWHGAKWTFVVWGILNAILLIAEMFMRRVRKNKRSRLQFKKRNLFRSFLSMFSTFLIISFTWIFFRADSISHAFIYSKEMFVGFFEKAGYVQLINMSYWEIGYILPILIVLFFIVEWIGRNDQYGIEKFGLSWKRPYRWIFYNLIVLMLFLFSGVEEQFIYFQF
jgi:alginate O-acetyltransferase complex protein AlgI